jgi:hypothetical protein
MVRRKVVVPKRMMGRYVAQGMMRMQMPGGMVRRTLRRGRWRSLLRDGETGDTRGKHGGDDKGLDHGRYTSRRKANLILAKAQKHSLR